MESVRTRERQKKQLHFPEDQVVGPVVDPVAQAVEKEAHLKQENAQVLLRVFTKTRSMTFTRFVTEKKESMIVDRHILKHEDF